MGLFFQMSTESHSESSSEVEDPGETEAVIISEPSEESTVVAGVGLL